MPGFSIPSRGHPVMKKPKQALGPNPLFPILSGCRRGGRRRPFQGLGEGPGEGAVCNGFALVYNDLVPVCPGTELERGDTMKSFWIGSMAAVIIAIVAGVVLSGSEVSTAEKFSTADTRR